MSKTEKRKTSRTTLGAREGTGRKRRPTKEAIANDVSSRGPSPYEATDVTGDEDKSKSTLKSTNRKGNDSTGAAEKVNVELQRHQGMPSEGPSTRHVQKAVHLSEEADGVIGLRERIQRICTPVHLEGEVAADGSKKEMGSICTQKSTSYPSQIGRTESPRTDSPLTGESSPLKQEATKETLPSYVIFNFTSNDYPHFDHVMTDDKDSGYTKPDIGECCQRNKHVFATAVLVMAFIAFLIFAAVVSIAHYFRWNHVKIFVHGVGKLRGIKMNKEGRTVYSFLGISYGRTTAGESRFRQPTYAVEANHVIDGSNVRPACPQYTSRYAPSVARAFDTSEDCLHVNIWTPCVQAESPDCRKTVIVFLFGIEFLNGGNNIYDGSLFSALGDVVLVTPNFRLGALGFLTTGTAEAPGNLALYDQELAVRWVRDHIENFGGNSSDIVLMGSGSGAWSIGAMLLSSRPFWRQHFTRFIIHSESPFRRIYSSRADDLGPSLRCPSSPADQLLDCLQALPVKRIVDATRKPPFLFGPSFDSELLPHEPWRLAAISPIVEKDILIGTVHNEGSGVIRQLTKDARNETSAFLRNVIEYQLAILSVPDHDRLIELYINSSFKGIAWAHKLISDVLYVCPLLSFADYLALRGNRMHACIFDQELGSAAVGGVPGATKFSDLDVLFRSATGFSAEEVKLGRDAIEIWTEFAKTGALPVVGNRSWPSYKATKRQHVRITEKTLDVVEDYNVDACTMVARFLPELNAWKNGHTA